MSGVSKDKIKEKIAEEVATNLPLAKSVLEQDLYKFNKHVLDIEKGRDRLPLAPVHKEICHFIDHNKKKKKLALIPRGHLKTTLITEGYATQKVLENPEVRVLIANATYDLACSFLTNIKRNLKFNDKVHMIWGDVTEGAEVWSQNKITLPESRSKEPTITAMGIESNLTSQHYDIIILDDLVNKDYVNTQDQINKTINFYKECLNLLEPDGEFIVIGTRWHDSDLYGWILDNDNNVRSDFDVFIKKAYEGSLETDEGFKALFPQKFTRKHLKKLKDQQGPYFFATQYLNDPIPDEDATFRKDWFTYYDPTDVKGRLLNKFVMVDPALSLERDADYTAIVTVGVDELGLIYVLDIIRSRLKPSEIIDNIFTVWNMYNPIKITIEDVAFQKTLQYSLSEEMNKRNQYLPIQPVRPGVRSKESRIQGLQPLYAGKRILHSKHVPNIDQLEDELLRFPRGKNDDIIDAMSYMLDIPVYKPRRKKTRAKHKKYLYA